MMAISRSGGKLRWKPQSLNYDALKMEYDKGDASKRYLYY
jgi:hypothetical protein